MIGQDINWPAALAIMRACRLIQTRSIGILVLYCIMTVLNAVLDGFTIVLFIDMVTIRGTTDQPDQVLGLIIRILGFLGWRLNLENILVLLSVMFVLRVGLYFCVIAMDGIVSAYVRRKIQVEGFKNVVGGDWEFLRDLRVGQRVGALTEEAAVVTKYLASVIRSVYFLLTFLVLSGIALMVSVELTIIMMGVGIPMLVLLQYLFSRQSRLSAQQTVARQGFASDVTERLSGLFQIKVEGEKHHHVASGLRNQAQLSRLEVLIGYCQASIGALNVLMPALALLAFYAWAGWRGRSLEESMHLLAGVGVVGARAASQLNGFIASWGNLSRLSGSILPVHQLFTIPPELPRYSIGERVVKVELDNVSYQYNGGSGVRSVSLVAERGRPLVLRGPSGSGKTTIANLMSGVYLPKGGDVFYIGASGRRYNGREFKSRVGYVTQEIYLFHGTVRENLVPRGMDVGDDALWICLDRVGATEFIHEMGGLDAQIIESGRSLSGGQKRRLGIARILVKQPDFIIFDEVTAGLDEENQAVVREAVIHASYTGVVVIITHEDVFEDLDMYVLA